MGRGAGGGRGRRVHAPRRLEFQTVFCSAVALIGWGPRVPANKAEGSWFSSAETLETQKRRASRTEPQAQGRADISLELLTQCMLDKKPSKGPWPTPPFDPRFPNQNQTRNCYQNFLDYHRCMKKMNRRGKSAQPCEYFFHVFHSLCPISWVERWTEQIKSGTFAGKI